MERLMTKKEYRSSIFRAIEFGDNVYTKKEDKLIFLAEKDGLYYCGLKGFTETIPYDYTGKCLLPEGKGVDVSDGKMDIDLRTDYSVDILDVYTVEGFMDFMNDDDLHIDPKARIIVDKEFGPVTLAYLGDGYFHIGTQRLSPNPYLEGKSR